jgi:hypothetical protein
MQPPRRKGRKGETLKCVLGVLGDLAVQSLSFALFSSFLRVGSVFPPCLKLVNLFLREGFRCSRYELIVVGLIQ